MGPLEHDRALIAVPKEDIFFAWLKEINKDNSKMRLVTMSFPLYGYMKKNLALKRSDIEKEMWKDISNGENMTEVFSRNEKRIRDYFGDGNIEKNKEDLS